MTEAVAGVDLVELQLRAAAGERLPLSQAALGAPRGHAFEARIYAESPAKGAARSVRGAGGAGDGGGAEQGGGRGGGRRRGRGGEEARARCSQAQPRGELQGSAAARPTPPPACTCAGFLPGGGRVRRWRVPRAAGAFDHAPVVRVDSGVEEGGEVGTHYDPMVAKLVARGPDRAAALRALRGALAETQVAGLPTNLGFLQRLAAHPAFEAAELDTGARAAGGGGRGAGAGGRGAGGGRGERSAPPPRLLWRAREPLPARARRATRRPTPPARPPGFIDRHRDALLSPQPVAPELAALAAVARCKLQVGACLARRGLGGSWLGGWGAGAGGRLQARMHRPRARAPARRQAAAAAAAAPASAAAGPWGIPDAKRLWLPCVKPLAMEAGGGGGATGARLELAVAYLSDSEFEVGGRAWCGCRVCLASAHAVRGLQLHRWRPVVYLDAAHAPPPPPGPLPPPAGALRGRRPAARAPRLAGA